MLEWFEGLAGPDFATAVLWTFAALILLVIVLVVVRLIRSMTFGTFVAGGRNRKTRLAVMDAAAVDSHRRLVLVRRDDVEHLILIGGPSDVVVERDIRLGQPRRAAMTGDTRNDTAPPPPRPRAPEPASAPMRAAPPPATRISPAPPHPPASRVAREPASNPSRPAPERLSPTDVASAPLQKTAMSTTIRQSPSAAPQRQIPLDDTLMKELEVTFDAGPPHKAPKQPELTLDDEMTKLLGELSSHKR